MDYDDNLIAPTPRDKHVFARFKTCSPMPSSVRIRPMMASPNRAWC